MFRLALALAFLGSLVVAFSGAPIRPTYFAVVKAQAHGGGGAVSVASLNWAPPTLVNPTELIIATGTSTSCLHDPGYGGSCLDPTKDYVVRCDVTTNHAVTRTKIDLEGDPNTPGSGGHIVFGGHVTGGVLTMEGCAVNRTASTPTNIYPGTPTCAPTSAPGQLILIKPNGMGIYAEGILVDMHADSTGANFGIDGYDIGGSQPGVIVGQMIRVQNTWGIQGGTGQTCSTAVNHSDGWQLLAAQRKWYMDHVSGKDGYQGLQWEPDGPGCGGFALSDGQILNGNFTYLDPGPGVNANGDSNGSVGYIMDLGFGGGCHPSPISKMAFTNVWAQARSFGSGNWQQFTIAPANNLTPPGNVPCTNGYGTGAAFTSTYVTFTGCVNVGIPPQGDYVPASAIIDGSGNVIYKSPGVYLNAYPS